MPHHTEPARLERPVVVRIVGDEEAAGDEPGADRGAAQDQEGAGSRRSGRRPARSALRRTATADRHARRDERDGRGRRRRRGDRPRLVAREAGQGERRRRRPVGGSSAPSAPIASVRATPPSVERHQQRLGHRRRLQVEHVGLRGEDDGAAAAPRDRSGGAMDQPDQRADARARSTDRHRDAREAGAVPRSRSAPGAAFSRWGSGSHTAPICHQPGRSESTMRRATTRWPLAS